MCSFQNALIVFALVLATTNLSYGRRWYGPDGIQPIRPLGPGGVQPLQPLGPDGTQKSNQGHHCAYERQFCECYGNVKYGLEQTWTEEKVVNGSIFCTNEVFGDILPGVKNECRCTPTSDGPWITDGECCFEYGFMKSEDYRLIPCCFRIITCEKHYQMLRMENGQEEPYWKHGKHHTCPQNDEEAHQILSGQN